MNTGPNDLASLVALGGSVRPGGADGQLPRPGCEGTARAVREGPEDGAVFTTNDRALVGKAVKTVRHEMSCV